MANRRFDLLTIGNALVDVLSHSSDEFIAGQAERFSMIPGAMSLISRLPARADTLILGWLGRTLYPPVRIASRAKQLSIHYKCQRLKQTPAQKKDLK